jgi:hypothetical protein
MYYPTIALKGLEKHYGEVKNSRLKSVPPRHVTILSILSVLKFPSVSSALPGIKFVVQPTMLILYPAI